MLAAATLGAALAPGEAHADCPATYAGLSCGALAPVCAVSGQTWTCNVTAGASTAWITSDSDATTQYEAYGTHNGTAFCCTIATGTTINHIILNGSGSADSLRFYDFINGGGTPYNLIETSGTTLDGVINAGDGADAVDGSQRDSANYSEILDGDGAVDTIHGGDGDDTCNGGAGADIIYGDDGDDLLYGQSENDTMYGGDGLDTMYGGGGADIMRGGNDDDDMYGEDGNDSMSGNAGDDIMNGGLDNDILCGQAHTAGIGDDLDDGDAAAGVDTLWGNGSIDDTCFTNNASTLCDNTSVIVGPGGRTGTAPTCP
jgi:Ca2+-binding RTX toxin-like protein